MNHLQRAKKLMTSYYELEPASLTTEENTATQSVLQTHALIAIAETNEGQMIATDKLVNEVVGVQNSLDRIAEQLERPSNNEIAWREYSLFDSFKDEWHAKHDTMAGFPYSDFYEFIGRDK